ncbi:NINE protein [Corynebacterium sp. ES2794-CONJ1]|uniref:TM2 domain-containing protein n=1 Tax=unclassified Corynebacterium TaxID=2624378 RepID=UPI0021691331|nr:MULTISPECIES: NINE protein [unclassified Corynebacterium]MCS4490752.1 NINE protein [Corynebacterium sp. ES2775-CONJ]MCS4492554.1 NINE protein [Corynebacterium sp. ES2715-CONJ3]MCS4532655.1 NINE protein [Corynebacterium sp. ES2730-CONJ]MCU9520050.1 NINE protein [Corynebacterium sp. ES2794-CONJ1]
MTNPHSDPQWHGPFDPEAPRSFQQEDFPYPAPASSSGQQFPDYRQAPVGPTYASPSPMSLPAKSWAIAAILAFFLGGFGAHNFYLGYNTRAAWQLGLYIAGIVTSFILIGIPIVFGVAVWAFVEFILILVGASTFSHDADGISLAK